MKKFLQAIATCQHSQRWVIAYSGGLDSTVLLHQLASLPEHPPLHAVHVNHQLSAHSDAWQSHAQAFCDELTVPLTVVKLAPPEAKGKGLEDAARKARYLAFESVLLKGDVLMMAHHQDDQIETMLLRLLRGAGARGLSGMPEQRALGEAWLLRPLLKYGRAELQHYAEQHQLHYIQDDSNNDLNLDRNYLRHQVLPLLEARWPGFAGNWAHSAEILASTADTLEDLAQLDAKASGLREEIYGCSLHLSDLMRLPPLRVHGAVRHACDHFSIAAMPRKAFKAIMGELIDARQDGQPKVSWSGGEARRFNTRLYLLRELPRVCSSTEVAWQRTGSDDQVFEAALEGVGRLYVSWARPPLMDVSVRVGFRRGGEIVRESGRSSKPLKQWFQEHRVPPWLRERTPLLFVQQQLVAVGERCVSRSNDWQVENIRLERLPC